METQYLGFSCKNKHYLVRESDIASRWPSISDPDVEHLILRNGFQYRATNLKEIVFVDLSEVPEKVVIQTEEPLDF